MKAKKLPKLKGVKLVEEGLAKGVINEAERADLLKAEELRNEAIQVDDFSDPEYHSKEVPTKSSPNMEASARMYGK